jgi:hypothetical protein
MTDDDILSIEELHRTSGRPSALCPWCGAAGELESHQCSHCGHRRQPEEKLELRSPSQGEAPKAVQGLAGFAVLGGILLAVILALMLALSLAEL